MSHLVTGATGNIGGRVTERLISAGIRPRVLARNPAKTREHFGDRVDIVTGDLESETSLFAAMKGVDTVFLVNSGHRIEKNDELAARAAKNAGVRRIVKLSALGARARTEPTAVALWHARGEERIRAAGVPFTFVQPVGFMSNALAWAPSIKTQGLVRASTGEGRIAMIHPEDIAAVATAAMLSSDFEGESLPITGPEALSYAQMVATIAEAADKPIRFESITDEQAHANLFRLGLSAELAGAIVELWGEVREGLVDVVTGDVERVTGHKPASFAEWVREHAAAFR